MAIEHDIILEMNKSTALVPPRVVVRVGDVATQIIKAQLKNDGANYTPTGSARLDILKADGTWARCTASISGSTVSCTLPSQAVSSPGMARLAHFVFYSGTTKAESTEGFELRILPAVDTSDPEEESEYYDDMLTQLYDKWQAFEKQAESQEQARVTAENTRKSNETTRQNNETTRKNQETSRVNAEQQRVTEFNTLKSQSQAATTAAQSAASNANSAANYAQTVADGLSQSVIGDEDVAAMKAQIDKLGSMLADETGFYYMDGTVYCPSAKASVSGSTATFGDTCSVSGTTITLA
jgi:predicted RNA-binding protein with PUA-like domain|nr:MAG TPA: BppU domain protein [Caudoviricetes sp.]